MSEGLLKCAQECMNTKKACKVKDCRLWIDFKDDNNCCLISIYEHGSMTLREIADRLGISFARVKQIETKALKKLKDHPDASTLFF